MKFYARVVPACIALLASVALLSGCAVMRIDVDVYKGPLANHEDVQMEQMAAMAIGAKPLLVELRDRLEWPKENDRRDIRSLFSSSCYKPGYIPQKPQDACWLKHDVAMRVNNILYLYEPRSKMERIGRLWSELNGARADLSADMKSFRPEMSREWASDWKTIQPWLIGTPPEDHTALRGLKKASKERADQAKDIAELSMKWQALLTENKPGEYADRWIFILYEQIAQRLKSETAVAPKFDLKTILGADRATYSSPYARFKALRENPDLVKEIADLVFREPDPRALKAHAEARSLFARRTQIIAGAYLRAHEALSRLLRAVLDLAIALEESRREASYPRQIEALTSLTTKLVEPLYLLGLLKISTSGNELVPAPLIRLRTALQRRLPLSFLVVTNDESFADIPGTKIRVWRHTSYRGAKSPFDRIQEALHDEFLTHPSETAQALIVADGFFRTDAFVKACGGKMQEAGLRPQYQATEWRYHGIVRAPQGNEGETVRVDFQWLASQELLPGAGGFEAGRLDKGLEELIEDYLNARGKTLRAERRKVLLEDLVRFAEKVLFVANYQQLLKPDDGSRDSEKGNVKEVQTVQELLSPDIEDYTLVLQAVGNSILVQADELRHRTEHRERIGRKAGAESQAAAAAFSGTAGEAYDRIVSSIEAEYVPLEKDMDDLQNQIDQRTARGNDLDQQIAKAKQELGDAQPAFAGKDAAVKHYELLKDELSDKRKLKGKVDDWIAESGVTVEGLKSRMEGYFAEMRGQLIKESRDYPAKLDDIDGMTALLKKNMSQVTATEPKDFFEKLKVNVLKEAKGLADAKDRLKVAKEGAERLKIQKDQSDKDVKALTERKNKAEAMKTQAGNALTVLRDAGRRTRILDRAAQNRSEPAGAAVKATMMAAFMDEREKLDPKSEDATKLGHAIEAVRVRPAPMTEFVPAVGPAGTALDVMDALIARLKYLHTRQVQEHGIAGAQNTADAVDLAYEYRSGMVYLRPAGAYLRNSFPATSLQGSPGLGWRNMLSEHGARSLPFFEWLQYDSSGIRRLRINEDIDKQFWQNINSVRVAGAGWTNYVIAKDDIGNWYVKSYSADTGDIIKSARGLAMFGIGAKMGTPLYKAGTPSLERKEAGVAAPGQPSALEKLYDKYKQDYTKRLDQDYSELQAMLEKDDIKNRITSLWDKSKEKLQSHRDKLDGKLGTASDTYLKTAGEDLKNPKPDENKGDKIVNALKAIKRFHNVLIVDVNQIISSDNEARDLASRAVTQAVRDKLLNFSTHRRDGVKEYENAVHFIGEALNQ
ncbi:MAG: hypothetical protein AB1512_27840 [Thermodesulfobacteriota bacterium]